MFADYSYYTDSWAGTLIPAQEFNSYARKAERLINYIVNGGVKKVTEPVKNAVCAAAEAAYELRQSVANIPQGIKSENTDGYSVTYKDYNADDLADREKGQCLKLSDKSYTTQACCIRGYADVY